jgi:hypothetical protein
VKRLLVLFLSLALLPLAGCGSAGDASEFKEWEGPPTPSGTGALEVSEFNDFLEEYPEFAWAPTTAATLFLRLDRMTAVDTSIEARTAGESQSPVTVEVTLDGLLDDSLRAQRYVLVFDLVADDDWRLTSAVATQRCQPGRGHQDFSAEPCV